MPKTGRLQQGILDKGNGQQAEQKANDIEDSRRGNDGEESAEKGIRGLGNEQPNAAIGQPPDKPSRYNRNEDAADDGDGGAEESRRGEPFRAEGTPERPKKTVGRKKK